MSTRGRSPGRTSFPTRSSAVPSPRRGAWSSPAGTAPATSTHSTPGPARRAGGSSAAPASTPLRSRSRSTASSSSPSPPAATSSFASRTATASSFLACRRSGRAGRLHSTGRRPGPPPRIRPALAGLTLALACALPVHADETPAWMRVDADKKIVRLQIVGAADGTNGTMNFNGYAQGEMRVIVPLGWTVHVSFRSEEHTSELQSRLHLVCRLLLEKKKNYSLSIFLYHLLGP